MLPLEGSGMGTCSSLSAERPHSQEPQSSLTFKVVCSYCQVRAGSARRPMISPWGLIDTGGRKLSIAAG